MPPDQGLRTALDRLHAHLRERPLLQRFTLLTRTLLAWGFIAPGLTKVLGKAFAPGIDPAQPMGAYFVAFHGTGAYYVFVGLAQITAALLLLSRRTALLGACIYLPIIANILVLVTATRFGLGTPILTALMTLGCLWLLVWDAHRLAPLLSPRAGTGTRAVEPALWDVVTPAHSDGLVRGMTRFAYVLGFTSGFGFLLVTRGLIPHALTPVLLLGVLAATLLVLVAWGTHGLWQRTAVGREA